LAMYFKKIKPNLGLAWLLLCIAFLLHVIDEATNDFLLIYNDTVTRLNENLSILTLPTFTFENWLTLLVIVILLLFSLSIFANRNKKWMIKLSYIYGIVMLLNGIGHIIGSIYLKIWMPGVYSSPILLFTSIYVLWSASQQWKPLQQQENL